MSDIVIARLRVRELARRTGLGIRDQACIALATSSLAYALRLGEPNEGHIDIYCSDRDERVGIQVVCTATAGAECDLASQAMADAGWMVDDLTVETLPPNDARITLVKWAT